jgi:hypothetical protein
MAERPVFVPRLEGDVLVQTCMVEFTWHPGMAISQKQMSIQSLHEAARKTLGLTSVLEISTKSPDSLGVALSAFNLAYRSPESGVSYAVELLFQSAKVFSEGGPYRDLLRRTPGEAKGDPRLKDSGHLVRFESAGVTWGLEPKTAFYDWLYLNVLRQQPALARQAQGYAGFTDIEFNPRKSVSCQAYSVALFVALAARGSLDQALVSKDQFLALIANFRAGDTQSDSRARSML